MRERLTYANVMATIAVFVALGGTSYAAVKLAANSVGAREIKAGAVRSSEIENGSVTKVDLARGVLPAVYLRAGTDVGSTATVTAPGRDATAQLSVAWVSP